MTLLELIVALAIFAVVGSAMVPVISGTMGSRRDASARVALDAEARSIVDRLEQDIGSNLDAGFAGALPPRLLAPVPPGHKPDAERVIVETTTLVSRGVTAADAFVGGEDVAALSVDRGDQADVLWRIDADGRLIRQEIRPPRIEPVDWATIPSEVVSERAAVVLEFYEPETWADAWDSGIGGPHQAHVPVAVRATVTVGKDPALSVELVSTVVLPVVETAIDLRRAAGEAP